MMGLWFNWDIIAAQTAGNLFSGSWIPLTGEGSANSIFANSTVGDAQSGDGAFFDSWVFVLGDAARGRNLPTAGTPLAFRFYDGKSLATSNLLEELSSPLWLWADPASGIAAPRIEISASNPGVRRISGFPMDETGGPIQTIAFFDHNSIPEPATFLILFAGMFTLAMGRQNR